MTDASPTTTEAEFWHVQLPSGEVRYWNLEELDEAFQRDEISAQTYVLKEGETTWMRLGELLGLDEVPEKVAVPIAPYSIGSVPPPSSADVASVNSIRPVVADLSDMDLPDDDLVAAMKPKKKNMAFIGGGVGVALLLAIVGLTRASGGSEAPVAAAAPPPPPVVAPAPETAAVSAQSTLSDDVKRQLAEADKAREAKSAQKAAERAAEAAKYASHHPGHGVAKTGNVFHKGGSKYDPLNAGN
jgi:hypothetical protein